MWRNQWLLFQFFIDACPKSVLKFRCGMRWQICLSETNFPPVTWCQCLCGDSVAPMVSIVHSRWIVCNPPTYGGMMLSINFPAIVHSTLPQFLRPVLGAGSIISIEAGQGLILKAVTPSNFIQMSSLSLPLSSPLLLPCSHALICRTEQTLDIFPSACQLSAR